MIFRKLVAALLNYVKIINLKENFLDKITMRIDALLIIKRIIKEIK